MPPLHVATRCLTFIVFLTITHGYSLATENLGTILRKTGWEQVLGQWVDAPTKGAVLQATYAWRFKDRVLEITTTAGKNKKTVSLMGLNAKTGEVYNWAADNQGGGSLGEWKIEDEDAILDLHFFTKNGEEGDLEIRHHLETKDKMTVTVEASPTIIYQLIRVPGKVAK